MFPYGSLGVGNGNPLISEFSAIWVGKSPWRRKWQPTPVFLPGKSHGQRNLEGYSPWGCKDSDTIEHTDTHIHSLSLFFFFSLFFGCCFITANHFRWVALFRFGCYPREVSPVGSWSREEGIESGAPDLTFILKAGDDICWEETAWSEGLSASSCRRVRTKNTGKVLSDEGSCHSIPHWVLETSLW